MAKFKNNQNNYAMIQEKCFMQKCHEKMLRRFKIFKKIYGLVDWGIPYNQLALNITLKNIQKYTNPIDYGLQTIDCGELILDKKRPSN